MTLLALSESPLITEELTRVKNNCSSTLRDSTPTSLSSSSSQDVKASQRRASSMTPPLSNLSLLLPQSKFQVLFSQEPIPRERKSSEPSAPLPKTMSTELRELSVLSRDTKADARLELPRRPKRHQRTSERLVGVSSLGGLLTRYTLKASVTATVPAAWSLRPFLVQFACSTGRWLKLR